MAGICIATTAVFSFLTMQNSQADETGEDENEFVKELIENLVIIPKEKIPGIRVRTEPVTERGIIVLVPRQAVSNGYVFVKDYDIPNAFLRQKVKLGKIQNNLIEVKVGLFPGDEVVVRNVEELCKLLESPEISPREVLDLFHGHVCNM